MKKCYHMTPIDRVRAVSNIGLRPNSNENTTIFNNKKDKVYFSEGMTGTVASYVNMQRKYDAIKQGTVSTDNVSKTLVDQIKTSKDMPEVLGGEGVIFLFDGSEVENEKNFMDGYTSQTVLPEGLQVCVLKNADTNETTYSRDDIIHYMMAKVPTESIRYSGRDVKPEDVDKETIKIQSFVNNYEKKHESEINKYKFGNYTLENVSVREFCENYLSEKESNVTGQTIGRAVEPELQNAAELQRVEQSLDILVNRSRDVIEQGIGKEAVKIREKKNNQ